jgi:predicted nucleic acid-binding protein
LGTAIAGKVEVLITVDKDLLDLGSFAGIPIIRPGEFWKRLGAMQPAAPDVGR